MIDLLVIKRVKETIKKASLKETKAAFNIVSFTFSWSLNEILLYLLYVEENTNMYSKI